MPVPPRRACRARRRATAGRRQVERRRRGRTREACGGVCVSAQYVEASSSRRWHCSKKLGAPAALRAWRASVWAGGDEARAEGRAEAARAEEARGWRGGGRGGRSRGHSRARRDAAGCRAGDDLHAHAHRAAGSSAPTYASPRGSSACRMALMRESAPARGGVGGGGGVRARRAHEAHSAARAWRSRRGSRRNSCRHDVREAGGGGIGVEREGGEVDEELLALPREQVLQPSGATHVAQPSSERDRRPRRARRGRRLEGGGGRRAARRPRRRRGRGRSRERTPSSLARRASSSPCGGGHGGAELGEMAICGEMAIAAISEAIWRAGARTRAIGPTGGAGGEGAAAAVRRA